MVRGLCIDFGWFGRILGTELDSELEETIFVRRSRCSQNQSLEIADILILVCDDYS